MRILRLLGLLLLAGAAACDSTSVPEGVAGSYTLSAAGDDEDLPVWANWNGAQGGGRQLLSGRLTLRDNGGMEVVLRYRDVSEEGVGGTQTVTLGGTWTEQGALVTLQMSGAGMIGLAPEITVASNRRLEGFVTLPYPAYIGYGWVPMPATFTR